jgi:Tfp pilus assembly protein PilF
MRAAIDRSFADPAAALPHALRTEIIYFHATESQTKLSYYFARDFSPELDVLRTHLGWVLPFDLLALVTDGRALAIPAVPVAASLATCVLFYVSSEYRHPVVPCLLLFAVSGARRAVGWLRAPLTWRTVAAGAGIALLFVATNARDPFFARLQSRRVDYLNFATLAASAGDLEEAERFARESVAIDPAWPVSRAKLAELARRRGAGPSAEDSGNPTGSSAVNSGLLDAALGMFRDGKSAEAREAFLAAAAQGGDGRATALNNAGLCSMRLERFAEAESLFLASAAADSAYASPLVHLGRLALAQGDGSNAARWARRALVLAPDDARAVRLLTRAAGGGADTRAEDEPTDAVR